MRYKNILSLVLLFCASVIHAQDNNSGVQLKKTDGFPQLLIDGKPFLILGGELGNSSASNIEYLKPAWKYLQQMHLNTVLVPVYWELLEPEENKFDFTLVDGMIADARQHNMKIVFLWFGAWKNSMSCYAPLWMKKNPKRFPRTQDTAARSQEIFSVFGKETLEADKKAFAALMRHTKEIDGNGKTVIMVQVENEIGMLPTSREFSKTADNYFNAKLPAELMAYLQKNKNNLVPELREKWEKQNFKTNDTWAATFGAGVLTDEIFQAWYYAKYTNEVTLAGKKEYNLPMYVNAALPRPGKLPGQYPSAGPLPQVMDIWQAGAPALNMLSPDFYNPDTKYWCDLYVRNNNTLFVPEIQFDKTCAAKTFFIIGHYKAIGFSPFSIESENSAAVSLAKSYDIMQQLTPFIVNKQWLGMDGFLLDKQNRSTTVKMGQYKLVVSHEATLSWSAEAKDSIWSTTGGIILQTAPDEFLVAGSGIVVTFENTDKNMVSNIAAADEVRYENGAVIKGRRMNGDQDHQGRHIRFAVGDWGIQKVQLYNSPAKIDN
ncbi:GH35 family beta-galactosidase [Ferruginibacter profundus]